ncbi:MAG: tRNA 2-thiouridine(34) synthase MnmA, partial [Desulfohalobiaceae bacterium]|nr:tRNA 2-thiouridine(34) synthase MnmA [Desulfohalobiaceae bacterium]
ALKTRDRLRVLCRKMDIPFFSFDLSRQFKELVIEPYLRSHTNGLTPNPCALCNREIKFGLLFRQAEELGAEKLATGHYARAALGPDQNPALFRGQDPAKEQSYFLALLTRKQVSRAVFPLWSWRKEQVLKTLQDMGHEVPLKKESQEVCFIPDDDYCSFLEASGRALSGPGAILDSKGHVLGEHRGLHRYTIGQRRGLRIPYSQPLYVLAKDLRENTLLVGTRDELLAPGCIVREINCLTDREHWPEQVLVQTRYRQQADWAGLKPLDQDSLEVRFLSPRKPATPGQVAAFYTRSGQILGGGIIH